MTILQGDVKLVKSQVMADVPEGGGPPTANEVVDGTSNSIFPDISENDRAAGRVSLRKVHGWVQSNDTDTYLGANAIIAEPPNDPNVSITLATGTTFDLRSDAISRIEAYLSIGSNFAGYLFANHITGMRAVTILQRTADLPPIGSSLALTKHEGIFDEFVQYIRVTEAKATLTTFTDAQGDFQRYVLELKTSDPLRADFPGFDASRIDPTKAQLASATKVSNVIVSNAAKYFGVVDVVEAITTGDFSIKASGIYTQLVPSAQIETPIGDARTNQLLAGVVGGGAAISIASTLAFTISQNLFIGGSIKPNTLSIANGSVTLTDSGGRLMNSGTQVGTVDYENGILSLLSNVFGTGSLTFAITYQPAAVPDAVTQSQGFPIKIENRSISYARTFEPAPVPGTLSVAYMVASRWYVLRDDGSGALRGPDSSYGSGQVNFTTGTVIVTLGKLPDVGSELIYQWVEPQAARDANAIQLDNNGKLYWAFNTSGQSSTDPGSKAITPGALSITWLDGATPRTVTDDGLGALQGYATGSVNYARGVIRMSPTTLPAPGTPITVTLTSRTPVTGSVVIASGSGNLGATNVTPGSISLTVVGQLRGKYLTAAIVDWGAPAAYLITDDSTGKLMMHFADDLIQVGTINYTAGTFTLNANTVIPTLTAGKVIAFDNVYTRTQKTQWAIEATS